MDIAQPEPGSAAAGEAAAAAPSNAGPFKYQAFLSYSHHDIALVKAIQEFIEDYPLPASAGKRSSRIEVYRDSTDIRTGDLGEQLNGALLESAYLIVCVSPAALQSRYVKQEVAAFRAVRAAAIIPVLLEGGPADVAALLGFESRYADLTLQRPGTSRFKAAEQLELVRVLARLDNRDVRTLVPWHEERRRRRRWSALAGALAVTLLLAGAGAGYYLQRQAARVAAADARAQAALAQQQSERAVREAQQRAQATARKQGDSALASVSSNFFAQAAVGLARLDSTAVQLDGGRYAQAARFLLPRLMTFGEAAASVGKGEVLRWGDSNLVRGPDGALREIAGAVLERVSFAPRGTALVAVDVAHRISLIAWPAMTTRGPYALGPVRIDAVTWTAAGRPSLRATTMELGSDEDADDAQADGAAVRIDLDADGRPLPSVALPAADAAIEGSGPRHARQRPAARLLFPRLRDESAFWRSTPPRPPEDKGAIAPLALRELPPYRALDMRALTGEGARQREFIERSMNRDYLENGMAVVDNHHLALASTITGNQGAAYITCEFDPATRLAAWCHLENVTATVRTYPSPDYRVMLLTMTEVQEDAFRLVNLADRGARCKVPVNPAERALEAAFDPTGTRLAVLTRDNEIWVYDLRRQPCEATVAARFALPDSRGSGGSIAFAGRDTLIWLTEGAYVHALDAASGFVKWSQAGLAPRRQRGDSRSISVSPDARLFSTVLDGTLELRSALTGVALSGPFPVFGASTGAGAVGTVCEVAVADAGSVRIEFDRERLCSTSTAPQLRKGRGAWTRLAPDDAALGFGAPAPLWRATAISDDDGKSPVPLSKLLAPERP